VLVVFFAFFAELGVFANPPLRETLRRDRSSDDSSVSPDDYMTDWFLRLGSKDIALIVLYRPPWMQNFSPISRVKRPVVSLALEASLEADYAAAK